MKLTQEQQDILFGTLLGDGNLQTGSDGKTWRYRAIHSIKEKDYLFHKYEILKPLCGPDTVPKESETEDERTGKISVRWSFNTLTQPELKFLGDMFYTFDKKKQKWIKDVPLKCEPFLTPRALAYFYMDDGALKWLGHSNAMRICTESFSHEGIRRLQNAIKNVYNIELSTTKKTLKDGSIGLRLVISERNSEAFREIIKPHLFESMRYKVSDGNRGYL